MKILFLHGTGSKPGDVRASYLIKHGHDVMNPALPDDVTHHPAFSIGE